MGSIFTSDRSPKLLNSVPADEVLEAKLRGEKYLTPHENPEWTVSVSTARAATHRTDLQSGLVWLTNEALRFSFFANRTI